MSTILPVYEDEDKRKNSRNDLDKKSEFIFRHKSFQILQSIANGFDFWVENLYQCIKRIVFFLFDVW